MNEVFYMSLIEEESKARWICCPMCDKVKCERAAADCDVTIYLKNKDKAESEEHIWMEEN